MILTLSRLLTNIYIYVTIYYNKEDILNYMRNNLKTHINNENRTDGIE